VKAHVEASQQVAAVVLHLAIVVVAIAVRHVRQLLAQRQQQDLLDPLHQLQGLDMPHLAVALVQVAQEQSLQKMYLG
jgi:hypothetical protein